MLSEKQKQQQRAGMIINNQIDMSRFAYNANLEHAQEPDTPYTKVYVLDINNYLELNFEDGNSSLSLKAEVSLPLV